MYKILSCGIFLLLSLQIQAQKLSFAKQKSFITIGYGLPNNYAYNYNRADRYFMELDMNGSLQDLGPIIVSYEMATEWKTGLGISVSYNDMQYTASTEQGEEVLNVRDKVLGLSARVSQHFLEHQHWDLYAMGSIGYNFQWEKSYQDENEYLRKLNIRDRHGFLFNAGIGVRYFTNSALGFFGELGYSNSHYGQLGVVFRFGPDYQRDKSVF